MKSSYLLASVAAFALFNSTANALNECMATLKDPHGSVVVSCDGGTKATLKGGEHFLAEAATRRLECLPKVRLPGIHRKKSSPSAFAERAVDEVKLQSGKDAVAKMAIGS